MQICKSMHELRILVLSFDPPFSTKNILPIHMIFERATPRIICNKPWLLTNTISHIRHILYTCAQILKGNIIGHFYRHVDQYFSFPCCIDVMIQLSCNERRRESADPDIMKSQQFTNISISQCTKHQSGATELFCFPFIVLSL